jgi:hypothetical protein
MNVLLLALPLLFGSVDPTCVVWFEAEELSQNGVHVAAETSMEAPIEDVLAALEDFDHYSEYMPRVRRAERRPGGLVYTEVAAPWPLKDVWFLAQVSRDRAAGGFVLRWTLRAGNIRQNSGTWRLSPLAGRRTRLRYEGFVELHHAIPPMLLRMVEEHELPKVVQAVRLRALHGGKAVCEETQARGR